MKGKSSPQAQIVSVSSANVAGLPSFAMTACGMQCGIPSI